MNVTQPEQPPLAGLDRHPTGTNEPIIQIITQREDLPKLDNTNFFHSIQLFDMANLSARQQPYMVVAHSSDGTVMAHLLAVVRRRSSLWPPYLYHHCRILGEGVYTYPHGTTATTLFSSMMAALCAHLGYRVLYIELSHLSTKMFAYRELKQQHFFPVGWMSIHNSLHSHAPAERLSERLRHHISDATARGVTTDEVASEDDFRAFMQLLKKHHWLKPKRYIPDAVFFKALHHSGNGRLCITRYRQHVIGCYAVAYSGGDAYLWYTAFRRKSFAWLHPDEFTLWHVLNNAHQCGCRHVRFLDVGLPFTHNSFREFILRFGGKPVSTYRWFHCSVRWVNALLSWIYRS